MIAKLIPYILIFIDRDLTEDKLIIRVSAYRRHCIFSSHMSVDGNA